MNEHKHGQHSHHGGGHADNRPYWKRAHRDWRFLLVVGLMILAMLVYVLSDDLALGPRVGPQQPIIDAPAE